MNTEPRDLGTYHIRVKFTDGMGFIYQWTTGRRYTHGSCSCSPLTADQIPPGWEDEADLLHTMRYMFTEGNYACDCNRRMFLDQAAQKYLETEEDEEDGEDPYPCGQTLILESLTVIRPDGSEIALDL